MKIKILPKDGDSHYVTKFLWFPRIFDGVFYWLETVTIRQVYFSDRIIIPGWYDICLSNPESGLPISIDPTGEKKKEHDTIEETISRFLYKGVNQTKIITTESPSVVIWSKTRKCIVGGKGHPDPLEVVDDGVGRLKATYDNNVFISLQNRGELTESDVKEINESKGIVVTNATYGKPYFRFGFIPN